MQTYFMQYRVCRKKDGVVFMADCRTSFALAALTEQSINFILDQVVVDLFQKKSIKANAGDYFAEVCLLTLIS